MTTCVSCGKSNKANRQSKPDGVERPALLKYRCGGCEMPVHFGVNCSTLDEGVFTFSFLWLNCGLTVDRILFVRLLLVHSMLYQKDLRVRETKSRGSCRSRRVAPRCGQLQNRLTLKLKLKLEQNHKVELPQETFKEDKKIVSRYHVLNKSNYIV